MQLTIFDFPVSFLEIFCPDDKGFPRNELSILWNGRPRPSFIIGGRDTRTTREN
ncbi:hypothetical protein [Scytonema sp. NUACC26]|uniref:hypothetical protein n=1 Tax=Scytonema sp. NUACC26 TaxID=3140176 RepID=UPI0038B3F22E